MSEFRSLTNPPGKSFLWIFGVGWCLDITYLSFYNKPLRVLWNGEPLGFLVIDFLKLGFPFLRTTVDFVFPGSQEPEPDTRRDIEFVGRQFVRYHFMTNTASKTLGMVSVK